MSLRKFNESNATENDWSVVRVILVFGFSFLPQNCGQVVGISICCSVNVDGVVVLLESGGAPQHFLL